ncbi:MAG: hypothetical protein JNJ45_08950 [Chthonomonas sp.]|nr:hypothetical protein [Chthonomonas sp.]
MTRRKKGWLITAGVALAVFGYVGFRFGPDAYVAYKNGLFEKQQKHNYRSDDTENLKAMLAALMLYHESEGQFPVASGWMDAIESRIKTNDLADGQAIKKLQRPGAAAGEYGYALNTAFGGKYIDDVKDQTQPLIYVSKQKSRNAAGDPKVDRSGMGITVKGEIQGQ